MDVVPILVGPTAIGKTAVSLQIAKHLPIEIISADSRQIYRYLDIGTAKPEQKVLNKIPHHFINTLNPEEYFSAGIFGEQARLCIEKVVARNKMPLVVGGSGFYIQALVDGFSDIDKVDEKTRDKLKRRWEEEGAEILYNDLAHVDPSLAENLKPTDKQRVLRGLEVYYATGKRLSDFQQSPPEKAPFKPCIAGITAERNHLYARINKRVEVMVKQGLVEEVKGLIQMGYKKGLNALNTVGYKEVFDYLENEISHEEMVEEIKKNSRRYAKRQMTWFRRDERIKWFNLNDYDSIENLAKNIRIFLMN